jgi:uncharacterized protein (TIGR01777 family)
MMRVIITGGTGLIGSALSKQLAAARYEVFVLSRNPNKYSLPTGVQGVQWDGKTADNWHSLITADTTIINLAGASIAGDGFIPSRWTDKRKRSIRQSRVQAGQAVVAGIEAAEQKPRLLIQASAVGYYGPCGDEVLTEASPSGTDFLASVCRDWEEATAVVETMGIRRIVTRIGVVLSMGGGALPITALPYRLFAGGPLGSGKQWWAWIHIDDVVNAMQFLLESDEAAGVFNLTAPHPLQNKDFGKTIGRVLGRPHWLPVPAFALKLALGEVSTIVLDGQRALPQNLQALNYPFKYSEAEPALKSLLQ